MSLIRRAKLGRRAAAKGQGHVTIIQGHICSSMSYTTKVKVIHDYSYHCFVIIIVTVWLFVKLQKHS